MSMRCPWTLVTLMISAFLLAACASIPTTHTEVIGSWKADNYNGKFSNLLVISHAAEPGIREKVESIMVKSIEKQGLHAVASSDIMPADEKINRKTVRAAMAGKGFDGVLVSRLLDVDQSAIYIPPSQDTSFDESFDGVTPVDISPGYVEHLSEVSLQINLYDTASKRLVWSLNSQTSNFSTVSDIVQSVSQAVINNLRAMGLI
jgi:hypothetical protein